MRLLTGGVLLAVMAGACSSPPDAASDTTPAAATATVPASTSTLPPASTTTSLPATTTLVTTTTIPTTTTRATTTTAATTTAPAATTTAPATTTTAPATTTTAPATTTTAPGRVAATASLTEFSISPSTITLKVGERVRWTNTGGIWHTTTGPGWNSGRLDPGEDYSYTFDTPGTFDYVCSRHPGAMQATVIVNP